MLLCVAVFFASCSKEDDGGGVKDVKLNKATSFLTINTTMTLTATVEVENVEDLSVQWASSDASTATVDDHGLVTAKKPERQP